MALPAFPGLKWLAILPKPLRWVLAGSAALWVLGLSTVALLPAPSASPTPSPAVEDAIADAVMLPPDDSPAAPSAAQAESSVAANLPEVRREDPTAMRRLVGLYFASGDFVQAVPFIDRLLAEGAGADAEFLSRAAQAYLAAGEFAKAKDAAAEVLRREGPGVEMLRVSAMAEFRLGNADSALAAAKRVLTQFPGHGGLRIDLATMEIEMGPGHPDYGKTLKLALAADPGDLAALYLQGRKHGLEGNYGDAEKVLRELLRRDPGHAKASAQLGIALFQQGKMAEAGQRMQAALTRNPRDYNSWYNLGEWHLAALSGEENPETARRRRAQALQSYLRALELNSDHVQAHFRVGVILHGNAQFREAIRHFEAALQSDSTHVAAWFQMGVAYQRLELADRARACLRRAFDLDPLNRLVIAKLRELS